MTGCVAIDSELAFSVAMLGTSIEARKSPLTICTFPMSKILVERKIPNNALVIRILW